MSGQSWGRICLDAMQVVIDQTGVGIGFLISSALLTGISGEIFSSSFQIPEPTQPTADASLWGWYRSDSNLGTRATVNGEDDFFSSYTLRVTGSSTGSWQDLSGNDNHFGAYSRTTTPYVIASHSPANGKPVLVFRGGPTPTEETDFGTGDLGLTPPYAIHILFSLNTWNQYFCLLDGVTYNDPSYPYHAVIMEHSSSTPTRNELCLLANEFVSDSEFANTPQLPSGSALFSWHILSAVFSGSASSSIQLDGGTIYTGSMLAVIPGGIHLGGLYRTLTRQYDGYVSAMVVSNAIDASSKEIHQNWLNWYGGSGIL
jgi:hypothetical protein